MSVSTRLSFAFTALCLLVLPAAAAQAQDNVLDQIQAARCRPCGIAHERCSVNCLGRGDKKDIGPCLIGCDNAAALCSCDEPATLSAEDYLALAGLPAVATLTTAACHATTLCGSAYGACTNWSSYSDCDDPFCGIVAGCGECNEWGQCEAAGPGIKQRRERYRVCFNTLGEPCTEFQRATTSGGCGCEF
jgi:hypothetical protein